MVQALVKAEIDTQIATAHAYPRSVARAMVNIKSLVTISQDAAEECNYALPRGGKPITGPSVRLAEIVASQWGNCRVGARVVHVDRFEKYVEAEGIFHDLETNMSTTARVRRRIVDSKGRLFNDDMIVVTGNAACSIAKRNAILGGIPKAVWNDAYQVALATVKGDVKTLPERRAACFKAFAAFGIKPEQIFENLEIAGAEDINLDHLATLIAMHKAIKDGEQQVEDYFPAKATAAAGDGAKGTAGKLADIAKGKAADPAQDGAADQQRKDDKKDAREKAAQDRAEADRAEAQKQHEEDMAQRAAETAQEGQAEGDADNAGPTTDQAYSRGRKAFSRGMTLDACPPDLKRSDDLKEAWANGWKDARDEAGE
jgi:ribosome modulation factor